MLFLVEVWVLHIFLITSCVDNVQVTFYFILINIKVYYLISPDFWLWEIQSYEWTIFYFIIFVEYGGVGTRCIFSSAVQVVLHL